MKVFLDNCLPRTLKLYLSLSIFTIAFFHPIRQKSNRALHE